ncbi:MAG: hypothetical protein ACKVU4_14625 [Phycisphaerales bacterium]
MNRDRPRAIQSSVGAACFGAAVACAHGQETAQLIVEVSQATLAPGQSTEVRVLAAYSPGVGGLANWGWQSNIIGRVAGFSYAGFNILGNSYAGVTGSWSNLLIGPGFSKFSSAGNIAGNNVNGVEVGTGFGPPMTVPVTANPVPLWSGTWTASAASATGSLTLTAHCLNAGSVHIWIQVSQFGPFSVEDAWPCANGQGNITVIPAPGAVAVALAASVVVARRRRSIGKDVTR